MVTKTSKELEAKTKTMKLEVIVRKRLNHVNNHEFTCYAVKMKDGNWRDLRFTKDVPDDKKPKAYSNIYVKAENISLDTRGKYVKVWVKAVERVKALQRPLEDLSQYFDEEPEDLPF
ncbi:MAG: hypothetical protein J6T10_15365 [Methanobrevibacter sp.]|nr:hypothetical protein [Methanobrevibacter sp.]